MKHKAPEFRTTVWLMIALGTLGLGQAVHARELSQDATTSWTNPIVPQRADPQVFLHTDGFYYLAATVPEYDRVELRRARTLGGLSSAEPKVVWRRPADGPMSGNIWAPELHFIGGKWYIYVTASHGTHEWWKTLRMYVLGTESADPLEGPWTELGQIKTTWGTFSLDATTFEHHGTRYFVWTQVEPDVQGTNIMIAKMDTPTSLAGEPVLISRPEHAWERQGYWVDEAPAVLIRHGRVFITFSASATDHNYCLGLLTAREDADLLDPKSWSKSPEPVFRSSEANGQFGPGHNSFTTTPDGRTDILVYHARNYKEIAGDSLANPDRSTRAQVIRWTPDGMPDFGAPVADGPYQLPPAGAD